jgi:hypothetical protein
MASSASNSLSKLGASPQRWGQSVWAVFAGFLLVVILSVGTDLGLRALKIFPPLGQGMSDGLFILATIYRTIYSIIGSYTTARLAPRRPMLHAMVGAAVGTLVGTLGALLTWKHTELGPHWYPVALIVTGFPCAWIGGKIREMQISA